MPAHFSPHSRRRGRWRNVARRIAGWVVGLALAATGLRAEEFEVIRLGLVGGEFATPGGLGSSTLDQFDGVDVVAGYSLRFNASGLSIGQAAWVVDTDVGLTLRVGLVGDGSADDEFTARTALTGPVASYRAGHQSSSVLFLKHGYAAGTSLIFNNTEFAATGPGSAAWIASTATGVTTRVGLFGAGFIDTDNFQRTMLTGFSELADAWGTSSIWDTGGAYDGEAAWVADADTGVTIRVGLIGTGYRSLGGFESAAVTRVLTNGYAAGHSLRYNTAGNTQIGQQAWVQNLAGGGATAIGLTGSGYFRAFNGYQNHQIQATSDGGFIGGYTSRYDPATSQPLGQGAWVYRTATATTTRVGFIGSGYRTAAGLESSSIIKISGTGLTIGTSQRFDPTSSLFLGRAGFVYHATTGAIVQVGLTSAEFTDASGVQHNVPKLVTNSGFVVGTANRYASSGSAAGAAAWAATASTGSTVRIGLTSTEFTASDTTQTSAVAILTESGRAGGTSTRYLGGAISGDAAWVANAATGATTRLGLTTANTYTSSAGLQESTLQFLTESGYAAGFSTRYSGADASGAAAWIFHAPTSLFTPIILSIRPSDQFSNTQILALYENGLALGTYELFNPTTGVLIGDRAFAWTPAGGAYDLGVDLGATLGEDGWASLDNGLFADAQGRILGQGTRLTNSNSTDSVYLLATIPEPGSGALALFGLTWCAWRRRVRG